MLNDESEPPDDGGHLEPWERRPDDDDDDDSEDDDANDSSIDNDIILIDDNSEEEEEEEEDSADDASSSGPESCHHADDDEDDEVQIIAAVPARQSAAAPSTSGRYIINCSPAAFSSAGPSMTCSPPLRFTVMMAVLPTLQASRSWKVEGLLRETAMQCNAGRMKQQEPYEPARIECRSIKSARSIVTMRGCYPSMAITLFQYFNFIVGLHVSL